MANIVVRLQGTRKIYRYDLSKYGRTRKTFIRAENLDERKVFVTTLDGECLIDGKSYSWSDGNEVYKKLVGKAGHKEYDSHCGMHKFLNIDDCEVIIKKIDTKEYALDLAKYYDASIDQYVDYIDNGAQWESTKCHNNLMSKMAEALKAIAETL